MGWTAVIDIGKTRAKATLWDDGGQARGVPQPSEIIPRRRRKCRSLDVSWNRALARRRFGGSSPRAARWTPSFRSLTVRPRRSFTTAGCCARRWTTNGRRSPPIGMPTMPSAITFAVTGSPALPCGLNLGLQLHWLDSQRDAAVSPRSDRSLAAILGMAFVGSVRLRDHQSGLSHRSVAPSGARTLGPQRSARMGRAARSASSRKCRARHRHHRVVAARGPRPGHPGALRRARFQRGTLRYARPSRARGPRRHGAVDGHLVRRHALGRGRHHRHLVARLPESRDCLVNVGVGGAQVPSARFAVAARSRS